MVNYSDITLPGDVLMDLVAIRRDLHAHPQTAFAETYAAGVVERQLQLWGVPCIGGVATTGVVGWITPTDPAAANRPAIALRADMDALPIEEQTGLPYAAGADYRGCMHACGHDGHTTILLGAARTLVSLRDRLPHPVKLIFQPAEEVGGGAAKMIDAGALDERTGGVRATSIVGLHNWPRMPLGTFATQPGPIFAGTDLFTILIAGRGGHAALPHHTADPVVAGAAVVAALQTVVSRNLSPTESAVVSVPMFHAGDVPNVIPAIATLRGTLRYFSEQAQRILHSRLREIATGIAAAYGCSAQVMLDEGYPPTINDSELTNVVAGIASRTGLSRDDSSLPTTTAEDFAFYAHRVPACFVLTGSGGKHNAPDLHTSTYDFNDDLIPIAVRLMVACAMNA